MRCLAAWAALPRDGSGYPRQAVRQSDLIIIITQFSQAFRAVGPRRQTGLRTVVAAGCVAAVFACGCRRQNKPTAPPSARPSKEAAEPLAPPIPAATLPELPDRAQAPTVTGGVLRVHLDAEPPTLDPFSDAHQNIGRVVDGTIYETLIQCRSDGYLPGLADRWDVSPDGLRISLHLRPGVRWHDQRPFGPMDVQATFERALRSTSPLPTLRALLADVDAVEVAPDRVARIRLKRPSGLALRALCEVPIQPEHQLRAGGAAVAALGRLPNGTGPFRMAAWERGKRIRLQRARPAAGGGPPLDEIAFEIDADPGRALSRARRGDLDIVPRVLDVHYPDQVTGPAVRDRLTLYRLTPERYSFVTMNHTHDPLGDRAFRHALSLLWDRAQLAAEVRRGLVRPLGGPPFGNAPVPAFDPKAAAQTLDAAGYRDENADGVRDRDGHAIRLTMLQPAGSKVAAAEIRAFALALRRAGILLDVVTVDAATLMNRVIKGEFDLAPLMWEGRGDDDPRPLFGPGAELNHARHRSDSVAQLLDQLRLQVGPVERAPVLAHLAEVLASDEPVIFLYRHDVPALVSRRVRGLVGTGDRLDLRGVWLAP